jgi:hypothetical protein
LREAHRVLVPRGRLAISDVVIEAPVPTALESVMGHVLCLAGALPRQGYVEALKLALFGNVRVTDRSQALVELLDRIERRAHNLRRLVPGAQPGWPEELADPEAALRAGEAFIKQGGAGYCVFVGRATPVTR